MSATPGGPRLVVVSNRLPVTARRTQQRWGADPSAGGLVAALGPVLERLEGWWVGSPGELASVDRAGRDELLRGWERDRGLIAVDLPPTVGRAFYEGYSNDTLWPLLHGFPTRTVLDPGTWHAYRDANERFAAVVASRVDDDDVVWIHDYQLMLVPGLLRAARPRVRIGFFLHVPFPSAETFRILPERDAILRGVLGADVVGFQTHEHLGAFRRSLLQVLGIDSRMDRVDVDGRRVELEARPVGIQVDGWDRLVTRDEGVRRRIADLRSRHAGRRLVLAVDRLDYTKGIPERLRAYRHFLVSRPEWRGRVTLIQVAVPSRERVPRYAELRRDVSELVGEINGELGTPTWTPVIYLRRSIARAELAALYGAAEVAWVASLRDGMNLVAKEYVACQGAGAGVLLLSEFAGAAGEMGEAIRVNPYDIPGSADALERALSMSEDERAERQAALLARIRRDDAAAWAERSVAAIVATRADAGTPAGPLPEPPVRDLRAAFRAAARRICYLDHDGTLTPLVDRPADAAPGPGVRDVVAALSRRAATSVVIVSGRPTRDLERWYGDLDRVWLAAEHGVLVREPGTHAWRPLRSGADGAWKEQVRPILEHFALRAPGSLVEEKEFSLAWHFRLVEPEFGEWLANEVAVTLDQRLAGTELAVLRGSKVIEVRFAWASKGDVATHLRALGPDPDFELAIGDDRTDEDLFERLPAAAWTVRVGAGPTRARYRVADSARVGALLAALGSRRR